MDIERDIRSPSSASNLLAVSHPTRRPEKAGNRRKNGSSKAFALLDTLIERVQKDDVRCDTTSTIPLIAFGDHDKVAGTEATQLQLSNWLIDELSRLDHLLVQADKMSVSINCCYWRIGFSYREFCKVRFISYRDPRNRIAYQRLRMSRHARASIRGLRKKTLSQNFALLLVSRIA